MKTEMAVVRTEEIRVENVRLHSLCGELTTQVGSCMTRIMPIEQYSRNTKVELKDVPVQPWEDLVLILKRLGNVTRETIAPHDIEICHRVPVSKSFTEKKFYFRVCA